MIELSQDPAFAAKASQEGTVIHTRPQHLHRDVLLEVGSLLAPQVDPAHATGAELGEDLVAPHPLREGRRLAEIRTQCRHLLRQGIHRPARVESARDILAAWRFWRLISDREKSLHLSPQGGVIPALLSQNSSTLCTRTKGPNHFENLRHPRESISVCVARPHGY